MPKARWETINVHHCNKAIVAKALPMNAGVNIDFVDAYIAAFMESAGISDMYSFDKKHILRVGQIKRFEP